MTVGLDRSPARLSSAVGVVAGVLAVAWLAIWGAVLVVVPGTAGIVVMGLGLRRHSRLLVSLGGTVSLVGVVLVGLVGAPTLPLLGATATLAVSWDAGENAVTVGERLGRAAETRRIEVVHIAATTTVAAVSAGGAYVVYELSAGSGSPVALVTLLVAAVLLTVGLRR